MASQFAKLSPLRLIGAPLSGFNLIWVTCVVWFAGAAYCHGYERLLTASGAWPQSLLWSAYGVLPWLVLFEAAKRYDQQSIKPLPGVAITALLIATGGASLLLEWIVDPNGTPLMLQLMRRLPAVAATLLLLLLARRHRLISNRQATAGSAGEIESLRRHAPLIQFIRAADNYLELNLDGQVWTRRITMREAEAVLAPLGFVRVHRSIIVNRNHVESIVRQKGGAAVRTRDGTLLPTGKAFSGNLRQLH